MKKLCLKVNLIKSNAAGKVINIFITTALFFIVSMFFSISAYAATISSPSDSLMPMTNKSLSASQLAAQRTADFSSVLNKIIKQPFASSNSVIFDADDTQNFFSTTGTATVDYSPTGSWGTINLNPDQKDQTGAVTLNTAIDMTQDFHFSWKVKISSSLNNPLGDGIGFVLHPLYKPGENITVSSSNNSQTLPLYFGRHSKDGSSVTTANDPENGQNLNSIGLNGGNLGISDLMNAFGFKIDTYNNDYRWDGGSSSNTFYGDSGHTSYNVYGQKDFDENYISYSNPYGAFVTTDYTGYSTIDDNHIKLDSSSSNSNGINITNQQWWKMDIDKTTESGNPKVTVTISGTESNNPNKSVSVSKNISFIDNKTEYGFAILASTGEAHESNQIKDINGNFTPAKPTLVTRYSDENGSDLQEPKVTTNNMGVNFTDTNNQPTISKDGKTYKRAQVNGTLYKPTTPNGTTKVFKQLANNTNLGEKNVNVTQADNSTIKVSSQYNNVIVLNYVYRQQLPSSSTSDPPITLGLKVKVNNGSYGDTVDVQPGDTITFQYTATNKSGPSLWQGVTAVQSLADILKPTANLPTDVTSTSKLVYIPLLNAKNSSNNLLPNASDTSSGTREVSFTYKGADKAKLIAQDEYQDGQITVNLINNTGKEPQAKIISKVAVYDQSQQLIDSSGKQLYGSYFYCEENANSPLANPNPNPPDPNYTPDDLGNHIPATNMVYLNETFWWLVDDTGKLTIFPHNIDLNTKRAADWPWDSQRGNIKSVDIRSGVTAVNSINSMFANMPHLTQIDLSNFDMSKVTDTSAMFNGSSSLKELHLGQQTYFPKDPNLTLAPGKGELFDPNDKNSNHNNTTKWQAVGNNGTVKNPVGDDITAEDLVKLYQQQPTISQPNIPETYTWDQRWWDVDNKNTLTIYPTTINVDGNKATDWPWDRQSKDSKTDNLRDTIVKIVISEKVTAKNSLRSMFANMSKLTKVEGLTNLDTSEVTNMRTLFWKDSKLQQIDLSNFDMSKVTDAAAMFKGDNSLWKITLGPKVQFPKTTKDNPIMDAPGNNTPFPENNNYVSRSKNWKEVVGQDDDYKPTGPDKKASDFIDYQGHGSTHTYVWEPSLAGYLTLASVPNQFDYGNKIMGIIQILTTAENQNFKVTDTRSLRAGLTWKVNVTASDLTSGDKQIKNNNESLFVFGNFNTPLDSSKTIYKGTSTGDITEYSWRFTPEEGIKLNLQSNSVPKSGTYKGTINYELVNSV